MQRKSMLLPHISKHITEVGVCVCKAYVNDG